MIKNKKSMLSLDYVFGILISVVVTAVIVSVIFYWYFNMKDINLIPSKTNPNYVNNVISVGTCKDLNSTLQKIVTKCFVYINSSNDIVGLSKSGLFCGAVKYIPKTNEPSSCDAISMITNMQSYLKSKLGFSISVFSNKVSNDDRKFIVLYNGQNYVVN